MISLFIGAVMIKSLRFRAVLGLLFGCLLSCVIQQCLLLNLESKFLLFFWFASSKVLQNLGVTADGLVIFSEPFRYELFAVRTLNLFSILNLSLRTLLSLLYRIDRSYKLVRFFSAVQPRTDFSLNLGFMHERRFRLFRFND